MGQFGISKMKPNYLPVCLAILSLVATVSPTTGTGASTGTAMKSASRHARALQRFHHHAIFQQLGHEQGWGDICSRGLGIRQSHPSTVFESRQGPEWLRHSL